MHMIRAHELTACLISLMALGLLSCGKPKTQATTTKARTYRSLIPVETTLLTLYPQSDSQQGKFKLVIEADYFARTSKGRYRIVADTLVLNPSTTGTSLIDSVVGMHDRSIRGKKVIELFQRHYVYGFGRLVSDTLIRTGLSDDRLYVNNDTEPVEFRLDSSGIAFLADSVEVERIRYRPVNDNACQTQGVFTRALSNPKANRIRVYLNNLQSERHYLQNWKWLIKGDTVFHYFTDGCEPNRSVFLQLARE